MPTNTLARPAKTTRAASRNSVNDRRERFFQAYIGSAAKAYFAATAAYLDLTSFGDLDDSHLETMFEAAEQRETQARIDLIEGLILFGKPFEFKDEELSYRIKSEFNHTNDEWVLKMSSL